VLTGLRVMHEMPVDLDGPYLLPPELGQWNSWWLATRLFSGDQLFSATYHATETDFRTLEHIVRGLRRRSKDKHFNVAVDRLHFSVSRLRPQDRLIDLIIAMEAIFGDNEGASTYKIAMRAAVFLGDNPMHRKSIADTIKRAYQERSALVHGGKNESNAVMAQLTGQVHGLVRDALRQISEQLFEGKRIPSPIDFDWLLLGGAPDAGEPAV
jgi:hypothetical protein